jgi:hypothetical protein
MRRSKISDAGRLAIGVLPVAAALLLVAGCGGSKAPPRYNLSGKVTYRGAAVPHGTIFFLPDKAKGNVGPPISVPIANGVYKTLPGRGPTGGPYLVTVTSFEINFSRKLGLDGKPLPEPLFPSFQVNIDLPKQDSTHDFVVPAAEQ